MATTLTRENAEAFLYTEARLLDERRYQDWLTLFTADGLYWIPSDENADPRDATSIMYDDAAQRERRIYQLGLRHLAQDPPSRTIHYLTNVETEPGEAADEAVIRCNVLLFEMRPGDHQGLQPGLAESRALAARCLYRLRREDDSWRIALKRVTLINRDLPLQNITFIL